MHLITLRLDFTIKSLYSLLYAFYFFHFLPLLNSFFKEDRAKLQNNFSFTFILFSSVSREILLIFFSFLNKSLYLYLFIS